MGYHLHGQKRKRATTNDHAFLRYSLAVALLALALDDIDDVFGFADPAEDLDRLPLGLRSDPQQPLVPAAVWTDQISIIYS